MTARPSLTALLLGVLAWPGSARSVGESRGPYYTSGPLQSSLVRDEPVPVYSADPEDPWNRIHLLLFSYRSKALVYIEDPSVPPPASTSQNALAEQLRRRFLTKTTIVERREGGDRPDFFFPSGDIGFLLERSRFERAAAGLRAELAAPHLAGRTPVALLLFQQDLWSRFDGLAPVEADSSVQNARRQQLRSLVGRLMAKVALSREELGRIRSNLAEAAETHPEIDLDLLAKNTPWRELEVTASGGEPLQTNHASTAGLRRVFRVFVRVPESAGGPSCLERFIAERAVNVNLTCVQDGGLIDGTRVLLLETPLAASDRGQLVAVPLVLNAEARTMARLDAARLGLADLPFSALHASRLGLSSARRVGGGLEALPANEPLPQLLGCFNRQRGGPLLPARLSCRTCHGFDGRRLMINNFMMVTELKALLPDNARAQERVIRAKERSADYQALLAYFSRN